MSRINWKLKIRADSTETSNNGSEVKIRHLQRVVDFMNSNPQSNINEYCHYQEIKVQKVKIGEVDVDKQVYSHFIVVKLCVKRRTSYFSAILEHCIDLKSLTGKYRQLSNHFQNEFAFKLYQVHDMEESGLKVLDSYVRQNIIDRNSDEDTLYNHFIEAVDSEDHRLLTYLIDNFSALKRMSDVRNMILAKKHDLKQGKLTYEYHLT
jgi:hypothetical protein